MSIGILGWFLFVGCTEVEFPVSLDVNCSICEVFKNTLHSLVLSDSCVRLLL